MHARTIVIPLCILLALSCAAAPATATATSYVPELVLGPVVPAYVSGTAEDTVVALTIGTSTASEVSTGAALTVEVAGIGAGLHAWDLSITEGGVTTTTHGFVLVDDRVEVVYTALQALRGDTRSLTALANLTAALDLTEASLRAGQNTTLKQLTKLPDLVRNVTASLAALASGLPLNSTVDRESESAAAAPQAPEGQPLSIWVAGTALALALASAPMNLATWFQGRRNRREALVLLLALAARSGITPDSPEFARAVEAFEGKEKKAAPEAEPAANATGSA